MTTPHMPRLSLAVLELLNQQRVAALGTLDAEGNPFVSMVPFAVEPRRGWFVLHVSGLAPHAGNIQRHPSVSLLVMRSEVPSEPVHALPRISWMGQARILDPDSEDAQQARAVYLQRFPEAEPLTTLGDFRFVAVDVQAARQVAGFGAARALDAPAVAELFAAMAA